MKDLVPTMNGARTILSVNEKHKPPRDLELEMFTKSIKNVANREMAQCFITLIGDVQHGRIDTEKSKVIIVAMKEIVALKAMEGK